MKIAISNDHRGYKTKLKLIKYLTKKGHQVLDLGCMSEASVDYPIYAIDLGEKIVEGEANLGIVICGTGIGVSIACNKVAGIRCAKPANPKEARLSKLHNDANVLALSSDAPWFKTLDIIDAFLKTEFSNEKRHQTRIDYITDYELKTKKVKRTKKKQEEKEELDNEC